MSFGVNRWGQPILEMRKEKCQLCDREGWVISNGAEPYICPDHKTTVEEAAPPEDPDKGDPCGQS